MVSVKTVIESPTFLIRGPLEARPLHAPEVTAAPAKCLPGLPAGGDTVQAAFRTVDAANRLLADSTKYVGDGQRITNPLTGVRIFPWLFASHVAMAVTGAIALGMYGDAPPANAAMSLRDTGIFCVFAGAPFLVAGAVAALSKARQLVQVVLASHTELSAAALEPLRATFHDPATSPLQRTVLGEVAAIHRAALDKHRVKGDAARALLDDLTNRAHATELDDDVRHAASAAVAAYFASHDANGDFDRGWSGDRTLEDIIAQTPEPQRTQLREVIYDLISAQRDYLSDDGRFASVLAGTREPKTIAAERAEHEQQQSQPGEARLTTVRL